MPNQRRKVKHEQRGSVTSNGSMAESVADAAFEVIVLVSLPHMTCIEMSHVSGLDFVSQSRGSVDPVSGSSSLQVLMLTRFRGQMVDLVRTG